MNQERMRPTSNSSGRVARAAVGLGRIKRPGSCWAPGTADAVSATSVHAQCWRRVTHGRTRWHIIIIINDTRSVVTRSLTWFYIILFKWRESVVISIILHTHRGSYRPKKKKKKKPPVVEFRMSATRGAASTCPAE